MRGLFNHYGMCGMVVPALVLMSMTSNTSGAGPQSDKMVELPEPRTSGGVSVEEALRKRRSVREYASAQLTLQELSQLLWAAQGITSPMGLRTAPSAGALYPLEVYVVAGQVDGLAAGVYKYDPSQHRLMMVMTGDRRADLAAAALGQSCIKNAPASLVFSAVYERTTRKYRHRGIFYTHVEVGHAAENVCLQAVSLNLGTVVIGAFYEEKVKRAIGLPEDENPLLILPVGKRS